MKNLLITFVLCAAGAFAAMNYHFIVTSKGLTVGRKAELTFTDTFVDTREWSPLDYLRHRSVTAALARNGRDQLSDAAREAQEKALDGSKDLLDRSRKAVGSALEKAGESLKR